MGLGKTRQAIVAMEVGAPDGPVLVVCPAALKLNWRREIRMVFPDTSTEVIGFDRQPVDGEPRGLATIRLHAGFSERDPQDPSRPGTRNSALASFA